jgi:hypothetical protein
MPSHFFLICHLNHLNLHLMYLIKCIKTINQPSQIRFFLVFLMRLETDIEDMLSSHKAVDPYSYHLAIHTPPPIRTLEGKLSVLVVFTPKMYLLI